MKLIFRTFFVMALFVGFALSAQASTVGKNKPANMKDPALIEAGKITYFKRCSFCHGLTGNGEGPVAQLIDPKPRDFTQPLFKFRTTASGVLPTDEDLFRTISRGVTGTPMTFFDGEIAKSGFTEQERWELISFIETLNDYWVDDEEYKNSSDPDDQEDYRYKKVLVDYANLPDPELDLAKAEKGKEVFLQKKCWECHGPTGRGNGESNKTLKTDRGFKVHARDLTKPWKYKGGNKVQDIFTLFPPLYFQGLVMA